MRWTNLNRSIRIALAVLFTAAPAFAIQPARWMHTTEAHFEPGETEQTVVTNLGDVKLAQRTEDLTEALEDANVIYDMIALDDATVYLAVGPESQLLRRKGDEIEQVLELTNEQIFCLDRTAEGQLLLGISGENTRLAVLDGDELKDLVKLEDTKYVWDTIVDGQTIYAATGIDGKLLRIKLGDAEPVVDVLLDANQANLLCLERDKDGRLFAGSDTDGLVYRITLDDEGKASTFVVYDAAEPEIGAIVVMDDATIYIGTADAEQAKPGRMAQPAKEEKGRPQTDDKSEDKAPPQPPKTEPKPEPVNEQAGKSDTDESDTEAQAMAPEEEEAESPPVEKPALVTAEQRDELREVIKKRLLAAREGGKLQAGGSRTRRPSAAPPPAGRSSSKSKSKAAKKGNAVYRIAPEGFVNEVFRESVMILRLLDHEGKLLIATGNEGQIYSVDVDADETALLADLEPQQIPAILRGPDGHILLGTANPAQLVRLDPGYAEQGAYTSDVLDAAQISKWGALSIIADVPKDTTVAVLTRSGNVDDPEKAAWSDWSEPFNIEHDADHQPITPRYASVASDPARFLQYQLKLTGSNGSTPVVDQVGITYVLPNLKPQINSIKTGYPKPKAPSGSSKSKTANRPPPHTTTLRMEWKAEDPNKDPMVFTLEYQSAGSDVWLPLDEDLTANRYEWNTLYVPDGRYKVRVTASDAPGNPDNMAETAVRTSDPVLIDNSTPRMKITKPQADGNAIKFTVQVTDTYSPVRSVGYTVDGGEQWHVVLPDDLIYDSTTEAVTIIIPDLAPGRHAITIRAIDGRNNAVYQALFVNITKRAKPQE